MFNLEARVLEAWLRDLQLAPQALVLSVASGNREMREIHQPFIHAHVFRPLAERGIRCVHHELVPADGVDIAGDLFDPEIQQRLLALNPAVVLCCNLLEHVADRAQLARMLSRCVLPGAYLLLTVPRSFQYHADPIDTYYRPTPAQIATLFPELSCIRSAVIDVESMWDDLRAGGGIGTLMQRLARHVARLITWLPQFERWLSHVHSTLWLCRTRRVSILLLRRARREITACGDAAPTRRRQPAP